MSEEQVLKDQESLETPSYSTFEDEAPQEEKSDKKDVTSGKKIEASNKKETPVTKQPKASKKEKEFGHRSPERQETEQWSFRLFGCLEEPKLCCATFFLPCYTEARNAEYFYEEELETGIGYCLGSCGVGPVMRWRIRQHKNIKGHMLADVAVHLLCPCCALVQENREIYGFLGSHAGEKLQMLKEQ